MNKVIQAYSEVARPILRKYMSVNSCISATAATIETLKIFGIDSKPVPTKFVMQIPEIEKAYASGLSDEERATARDQSRIWEDGWDGHLVAVSDGVLIDASIDQAFAALFGKDDPQISLFPLGSDVEPESMYIKIKGVLDNKMKVEIIYQATVDYSFRDTAAWTDIGIPLLAADELYRAVDMKLKGI